MDARDIDLKPLLEPNNIAVVGASKDSGPGKQVIDNLTSLGYEGEIFPVNPKYEEVAGRKCYSSLEDLSETDVDIDLVAILLRNEIVPSILKEANEAGAKAVWAFASGFAEAGEEGEELQREVTEFCNEHGMAFHGPNCVGLVNTSTGVAAYSAPLSPGLEKGNVGVVAQSGSLSMAMANSSLDTGFSYIISSGNEAQLDSSDYMSYMIDDENTDVIVGFIEQFRDPERLDQVARKAEENDIPIIVLKVGKSDIAQRATQAHTAAIAGSDEAHDAFFQKRGIIRVGDMDQLLQTATLFAKLKKNPSVNDNVGVLTLSGGEIGLIGDVNDEVGLNFPSWSEEVRGALTEALPGFIDPRNPLDAWGAGDLEETYPVCMEEAAKDPGLETIIVSLNAAGDLAEAQLDQFKVAARAAAKAQKNTDKRVVVISNISSELESSIRAILEEADVPFLKGTREGFKAVKSLVDYGQFLKGKEARSSFTRQSSEAEEAEARKIIEGSRDEGLTEFESKKVLEAYGIPTTEERLASSLNEALENAKSIGFPVSLKVLSPQIQHKTEAGVIALDLGSEEEIEAAYREILENAESYDRSATINGVLVQEMVTGESVEVIVGFSKDRNFGPVITFGLGGIFVELFEDVSLKLPPLSEDEARNMIKEPQSFQLLKGFRGGIEADIEGLIDVIVKVSHLADDLEDTISALDINPLMVKEKGEGLLAADALIDLT